jgi:hypothetical protein
MNGARGRHTATLLPSGHVLAAGGFHPPSGSWLASTELYDPAGRHWSPAAAMITGRELHTATLLLSGRVLIAGGDNNGDTLSSAELYESGIGVAATINLTNTETLPGGAFRFGFTNTSGVSFSVLSATNPTLPFGNWTYLGSASETPPGQFQFTDPQATNGGQRFYRVRSP